MSNDLEDLNFQVMIILTMTLFSALKNYRLFS